MSYDDIAEDTELANHITYDSYGQKTAETDAAIEELFGYTGRAFDETTGLQNNLNRWLDAASGKWLSEDPIGFNGGDANLARYVGNHPTGATDPNGLFYSPSLEAPSGGSIKLLRARFDFQENLRNAKITLHLINNTIDNIEYHKKEMARWAAKKGVCPKDTDAFIEDTKKDLANLLEAYSRFLLAAQKDANIIGIASEELNGLPHGNIGGYSVGNRGELIHAVVEEGTRLRGEISGLDSTIAALETTETVVFWTGAAVLGAHLLVTGGGAFLLGLGAEGGTVGAGLSAAGVAVGKETIEIGIVIGADMLAEKGARKLGAGDKTIAGIRLLSVFAGYRMMKGRVGKGGKCNPKRGSFIDDMTPAEAARYEKYWKQGHADVPHNTRQREYTTPGTRSIRDQKISSETGELYTRETIYDDFGRRIGNNDFTDHGRPNVHSNPHHHPNSPFDPKQHGPVTPGLHPLTPRR